jgi:hypothetical protein
MHSVALPRFYETSATNTPVVLLPELHTPMFDVGVKHPAPCLAIPSRPVAIEESAKTQLPSIAGGLRCRGDAIANLASISDLQLADLDDDARAELACMLSEVHGLSWSDEGSNRGVQAWTPSY